MTSKADRADAVERNLLPDIQTHFRAIERVERLLRRATRALEQSKVEYAVVGGNAVAAWVSTVDEGATRATRDVDILVRRQDLPNICRAFVSLELQRVDVLSVVMFVERARPNPRSGLHLVFANELIRPDDAHAAPDVSSSSNQKKPTVPGPA